MKSNAFALAAISSMLLATAAAAQYRIVKTVTSDAAIKGAEACENLAEANHYKISIWVLDASGMTLYMHRMEGASLVSAGAAKLKAQTSWQQGNSTMDTENRIAKAPTKIPSDVQAAELNNFPDRGGYAVLVDDPVARGGKSAAGSVGVAGAEPAQNDACAHATMDAIANAK